MRRTSRSVAAALAVFVLWLTACSDDGQPDSSPSEQNEQPEDRGDPQDTNEASPTPEPAPPANPTCRGDTLDPQAVARAFRDYDHLPPPPIPQHVTPKAGVFLHCDYRSDTRVPGVLQQVIIRGEDYTNMSHQVVNRVWANYQMIRRDRPQDEQPGHDHFTPDGPHRFTSRNVTKHDGPLTPTGLWESNIFAAVRHGDRICTVEVITRSLNTGAFEHRDKAAARLADVACGVAT